MNGLTVVRSPSMIQRRQPLLAPDVSQLKRKQKFGEMAGGTAADCAAVCLLPMCGDESGGASCVQGASRTVQEAWSKQKKRRRIARRKQVGGLLMGPSGGSLLDHRAQMEDLLEAMSTEDTESVLELEKEIWERFQGAGFWRSPTRKEEEAHPHSH
ncbi:uncharacterized protein LOC123209405 [Mangifera indica]|uniref:uncharacterized protein LOC123209405 n=1 Tax=Mangifera indica TaxID=29780 RepID=UPI001CFC3970|nr:uncharacterized protein LOC123209405 [Mangifera indica]